MSIKTTNRSWLRYLHVFLTYTELTGCAVILGIWDFESMIFVWINILHEHIIYYIYYWTHIWTPSAVTCSLIKSYIKQNVDHKYTYVVIGLSFMSWICPASCVVSKTFAKWMMNCIRCLVHMYAKGERVIRVTFSEFN